MSFLEKIREKIKHFYNSIYKSNRFSSKQKYKLFIIAITVIFISITMIGIMPKKIDVKVGELSQEEIRAPKDIVDEEATEALKLKAVENVDPKYRVDTSIQIKVKNKIKSYFELIGKLRTDGDKTEEEKIEELKKQKYIQLKRSEHSAILFCSDEELLLLENNIYEVVSQSMNKGIEEEDLNYEKNNTSENFEALNSLSSNLQNIGSNIVVYLMEPNKFLDMETTNKQKEEASEKIEPVIIREGDIIVEKDKLIDSRIFKILEENKLIKTDDSIEYRLILGSLFIVIIIEGIAGLYIYHFERKIFDNKKIMMVILLIVLMTTILSKGIFTISGYLMPIALSTILLSILVNTKIALLANLLIGIFLIVSTDADTGVIVTMLSSSIIGCFAKLNVQQRSKIILIGILVSLCNMIIIMSFSMIYSLNLKIMLTRVMYGAINGVLSATLAIGSMPVWENIFGILTPMKLLELINPKQQALKDLLVKASGTYYHSILVGNLAENAAEKIDADSLLVRVGAYYHDIGKTKRPYFFKENQVEVENPHDKLSPKISARVIISHVTEGLKIAEKYKLPKEVKAMIDEHHGSTQVSFFYYKELERTGMTAKEGGEEFESFFRYPGKKPQSKETGILMMADSVEAASRASKNKGKSDLENIVKSIIKGKLDDGQLEESGLSLTDLKQIENSFIDTLEAMYHKRIEYPEIEGLK